MKTKVKFLIEVNSNVYEKGYIFAFFPEEKYSNDKNLFTCYAHVGQHSACHIDYAKECKKAKKSEYLPLMQELESIGYKLQIIK